MHLSTSKLKPVIPFDLVSGYRVSYSIDEISNNEKYEHMAISKRFSKDIDSAEEDWIAKKILGEGYEHMGTFFSKDVTHYRKLIKQENVTKEALEKYKNEI